jgi:hypothetical protein
MTATTFAQSPEKMNYQAVVRDSSNNLVTNQTVGMRISILQTSVAGTVVYSETQTPMANINGLVTLEIGAGTVISADFMSIDWSEGPNFIKTEMDPTGGSTYTITCTSQLISVPYAISPKTALEDVEYDGATDTIQTEKEETLLTIKAQFIDFNLGDTSHYTFKDLSGNHWDFSRCNSKNFEFSRLLDEAEMNTHNQGWGSTKELQGKWFKISYSLEERPLYQDGPMGTVQIIQEAELMEKFSTDTKTNDVFSLESNIMKVPSLEGFVYSGNKSPKRSVELVIEPIDPTSDKVTIKSASSNKTVEGVYLSPLKNYWSENGKYVILNNVDTYAGSGTYSIVLLNVESVKYVSTDMDQLFEGIDVGDREMLYIKNIVWLNDQSFFIESYVSYLGYSGHPGIDADLKNKLGDTFAKTDDIVTLPTRKYTIN